MAGEEVEDLEQTAMQLQSTDEETRRLAVGALAAYPFDNIRNQIAWAMGDESWRVRKETVDLLVRSHFTPDVAEFLVEMLRSHDNAGLRNSAVESLERIGKPAVPILSRYIDDPDSDVRKFIIDILGNISDPVVVPRLIGALADKDPNVSAAAAENLGKIGDPAAVPHLVDTLHVENLWLCHTILEALKNIGKPVPIAVIAPLASHPFLRKVVFDCLGVVGDMEAVPLLLEGLHEGGRRIREAAVVALDKVGQRAAGRAADDLSNLLKGLKGTDVVDVLLSSLESADPGVRGATVAILGSIGDARAVSFFLRCCHDEMFRRRCIEAIHHLGEEGVQALLREFQRAGDEERCLIAYIYGEISCTEASDQLVEGMQSSLPMLRRISLLSAGKIGLTTLTINVSLLLDDPDPEVRETAVQVLATFASREGAPVRKVAERLAGSDNPESRHHSAMLLAALKDVEKLSRLQKDEDPLVRKAAVVSLAELKDQHTVGTLVMALADEDSSVRIAAAGGLAAIGGNEARDALILALSDEDIWVQCAALRSLARYDAATILPVFREKLATAEGIVLVSLIETLGELGSDDAWNLIVGGLDNSDPDVVKSAINMLQRDGELWIEKYWTKLVAHPHWDVRVTFARVAAAKLGAEAAHILRAAYSSETDDLVKGQIAELLGGLE